MAASTIRLAIDLSGSSIRIVEGGMGGAMRCGSAQVPTGASTGGKVSDPSAVAQTLKALLARSEVTLSRALVTVSDALATFRVLRLESASTPKDIDAAVARELPFDPQQMSIRWQATDSQAGGSVIYAVAWDRSLLKGVTDAVRQAGIEPSVVELKSASVARTVPAAACLLVDMSAEPGEVVLIDAHLPRVWHTFPSTGSSGEDALTSLAQPIRSMLRFYRRSAEHGLDRSAPTFIATEQVISHLALAELSAAIDQPVQALPAPARVPPEVRHATYLACLGLLMRRAA